jgi:hypothetical protein
MAMQNHIVSMAGAVLAAAGVAAGQQSVSINLAGLQIRNGVNQSGTSAPNTISPAYRYHYNISGTVHGVGGVLGILFSSPTPLAQVLETLSPGSSAALMGDADNCSGSHPITPPPITQMGQQTVLGITVNYAVTLAFSIGANNIASFSISSVTLSPAALVGYIQFDTGSATISRVDECLANCDNSTSPPILNVNDFICFQSRFAAGDSYANCDCSTTPPVLNVNDFICFQSRFAAGCP